MKTIVFTVHGIRTFGQWQQRLEELVLAQQGRKGYEYKFFHRTYGYFSVFKFINPLFRLREVRRFRQHLIDVIDKEGPDRIVMVGHSFGTHIIAHSIKGLRNSKFPKINLVILSGSVLQKRFPWHELQPTRVEQVANECGTKDSIIAINALLPLGSGLAGRHGFDGVSSNNMRNRFFNFGHSGYFVSNKEYDDPNWFMDRYWVPLITDSGTIEGHDERPSGSLQGFKTWIIDQFPNLKWTIPLIFVVVFLSFVETRIVEQASSIGQENSVNSLAVLLSETQTERKRNIEKLRRSVHKALEFKSEILVRLASAAPWVSLPNTQPSIVTRAAASAYFNSFLLDEFVIQDVKYGSTYFPEFLIETSEDQIKISGSLDGVFSVENSRSYNFDNRPMISWTDAEKLGFHYDYESKKVLSDSLRDGTGEEGISLVGDEENLIQFSKDKKILITIEKLQDEGAELDKSVRIYNLSYYGGVLKSIPGDIETHNLHASFSSDDRFFAIIRGYDVEYNDVDYTVKSHLKIIIYAISNPNSVFDIETDTWNKEETRKRVARNEEIDGIDMIPIAHRNSVDGDVEGSAVLDISSGGKFSSNSVSVIDSDGQARELGTFPAISDFYFNHDGSILAVQTGFDVTLIDVTSGHEIGIFNDYSLILDDENSVWMKPFSNPNLGYLKVPNSAFESLGIPN